MNFKNILKLSSLAFFAAPTLAQLGCDALKKNLENNTKLYLREGETLEKFPPVINCGQSKTHEITELSLVSKRIDKKAVEQALSKKTIRSLTYVVDNEFYQRKPAVYADFPVIISRLPNLNDLTLKFIEQRFRDGDYFYVEKKINANVLKLSSHKLNCLILDHIMITKEVVKAISKIKSLQYLVIESGANSVGKSTSSSNYQLLKGIKNVSVLTIDGTTYNMNVEGEIGNEFVSTFTGECKNIQISLLKDAAGMLHKDEKLNEFEPLKTCIMNKKGKVTELYLVSSRNYPTAIENALSHKTITKLTYMIDDGFYQHEPAYYQFVPYEIGGLPNLKELTLKYYRKLFDHGEYPLDEKEINVEALEFSSKRFSILTLDHIKVTKEVVNKIKNIRTLKKLIIISADKADKTYYKDLRRLRGVKVIFGQSNSDEED